MADRQATIAAIGTPPGSGGIGIVRLSGPDSLRIAHEISGTEAAPRHAHFCTFRDQQDRVIDQGILIYFKGPNSFTGEDVVELHGHGGQTVLGMLLQETLLCGARLARAGEFTERAYLNDRIDLVQAEAIADLIHSVSAQAARSAARSLEGEFSENIKRIIDELINIRVFVESALDFAEEEIGFLSSADLIGKLTKQIALLDELLNKAEAGSKLRAGMRAAIVGKPNVGKSSLLNRMAKTNRAIVNEIAGTTRDTIEETVLIAGVPVNIVDTAGIRESTNPVEQEGIRRSRDEMIKADVILLVTDSEIDESLPSEPEANQKYVIIHNKIDVYGKPPSVAFKGEVPHVYLSARTGAGMELLEEVLHHISGAAEAGEDIVLARQRHIDALRSAKEFIVNGATAYNSSGSSELLAEELRKAQQALGAITGEFHNEDLLGEIFSRFCIGK